MMRIASGIAPPTKPSTHTQSIASLCPTTADDSLSPFELWDEEDFAPLADRLIVGGLVKGAVDRDGGFLFEMLTEAGVEAVHLLDDAAQVLGLDCNFPHAAGVAAAKTGRELSRRAACDDRYRGHGRLVLPERSRASTVATRGRLHIKWYCSSRERANPGRQRISARNSNAALQESWI